MAIDILTRDLQVPIIVGDKADMRGYRRCSVEVIDEKHAVILSDDPESGPDSDEQRLPITDAVAANIRQNEYALLIALTPDDEIDQAFLTPINDGLSPFRKIDDEAEIRRIAEALVSGDFNLSFIR